MCCNVEKPPEAADFKEKHAALMKECMEADKSGENQCSIIFYFCLLTYEENL